MATRIVFGRAVSSSVRFVRTTVAQISAAKAVGGSGFAVCTVLATASSSLAITTKPFERDDERQEAALLQPEPNNSNTNGDTAFYGAWWKAALPMAMAAPTTTCEANNANAETKTNNSEDAEYIAEANTTLQQQQPRKTGFATKKNELLLQQLQSNRDKLRRRMTNVGRFSLVSETERNPSVPVIVLAMTGKPYYASDFCRLYKERGLAEKHPRFHARLDETKTHFVFDDNNDKNKTKKRWGKGNKNVDRDNVRDVLFPSIPVAEMKDRVNDASLYEPLDLNSRLWEAWTATGGALGQSGLIVPSSDSSDGVEKVLGENEEGDADVESLLLFRAHHCMADGVSLGALFGDLMDEGPEIQARIRDQIKVYKKKKKNTPWWKELFAVLYYWVWGSIRALLYQAYLFAASWYNQYKHDDPWVVLKSIYDEQHRSESGKAIPPRSISWGKVAPVEEAKRVAKYYSEIHKKQTGKSSKVTINDVFCSCVSSAIVKQLSYHRAVNLGLSRSISGNGKSNGKPSLSLPSMNLIMPVHLQGGILLPGQSMGNKIGAMVSRIPGESVGGQSESDNIHMDRTLLAQERLIKVHSVLHQRKQTPAAALSYLIAGAMGYLSPSSSSSPGAGATSTRYSVGSSPSSWTPWLFKKAHANASVVVTNVRGPESPMHLEGRPVRAFVGFLPLPAGVPVGLVVSSYGKQITLAVTAEEYAVPNADKFLGWVREEYELLKQGAEQ